MNKPTSEKSLFKIITLEMKNARTCKCTYLPRMFKAINMVKTRNWLFFGIIWQIAVELQNRLCVEHAYLMLL